MDRQPDGLILHLAAGDLRVQILSSTVVRVAFAKSPDFFTRASIDVIPHDSMTAGWKLAERPTSIVLSTAKLQVIVNRSSGAVSFTDAAGRPILSEAAGSRTIEPATVQGEDTSHIQQRWRAQPGESLYGLGQMQLGITDIKGYDLDLWQHNTNIVVPFLVSSRGYGILWDNTSFTRFGDLRPFVAIPPANLLDADGKPGGLTLAPAAIVPPVEADPHRSKRSAGKAPSSRPSQATTSFRPTPTAAFRSGSTAS
jgi:alpha-D-xyloside xylohydrolase